MNLLKGARAIPAAPPEVLKALDHGLLENGLMPALPAEVYRAIPHWVLLNWLNARGRYQVPTLELVEWLRARINGRTCVEIGAGYGEVGRNVGGVRLTDSHFQTSDVMRDLYKSMGTVAINPPTDVRKLEGVEAVRRYRPQVALACWVTQLYQDGDSAKGIGSCVGGVDELEVLEHVGEYIFVGNAETHKHKRIFELPHEELNPPWLVSRAHDQTLNRIWIWKGNL